MKMVMISSALAAAALMAASAPAQPQGGGGQPDWLFVAKDRAAREGISVGEAVRRIRMQERLIRLQERLLEQYPDTFSGLVIEGSKERYGFRALFKRQGLGRLKRLRVETLKSPRRVPKWKLSVR
jgi:hypothetical protein